MMYHPRFQEAEEKGQSHRLAACWDVGLLPEEAKSPLGSRPDVEVIWGVINHQHGIIQQNTMVHTHRLIVGSVYYSYVA